MTIKGCPSLLFTGWGVAKKVSNRPKKVEG